MLARAPHTANDAETKGDLRLLFNAMPIGVFLVRADGRIGLANTCALEQFGYGAEELVGQSLDLLVPESLGNAHLAHRHNYAANPTQRAMGLGRDLHALRKDGTTFPVEIGLSPFDDGGELGTLCTVLDITERKRIDREKDQLVRTLAEKNAEITALYRVSKLTREGTPDPAVLRDIAEAVRAGLLGDAPVAGVKITLDGAVSQDSRFVSSPHCLESAVVVEGRVRGMIEAFLEPPTIENGQRRIPRNYEEAMTMFAGAVAESLERAEAHAKVIHVSQLASIGELAAGIGHEVNNPINGIINCVDILLRKAEAGTKERQYLDLIKQESYRIASVVGRLLAFSRSGDSPFASAQIGSAIENILVLCRKRIEKSQVLLKLEIADDLPVIRCQPEQVQQVLLNLMLNAVHALDERYPERDPNKVLTLAARQTLVGSVPHVDIVVEDRGVGIRPEHRDRIFDPFFSTKGQQGTGLGLSVSLNIVRAHGGWIHVESEPGQYTRFVVQCPVEQPETGK